MNTESPAGLDTLRWSGRLSGTWEGAGGGGGGRWHHQTRLELVKEGKTGSEPGSRGLGAALRICEPGCARVCLRLGLGVCLAPIRDLTAAFLLSSDISSLKENQLSFALCLTVLLLPVFPLRAVGHAMITAAEDISVFSSLTSELRHPLCLPS